MQGRDASAEIAPLCSDYFHRTVASYVPRKEYFYSWRIDGDTLTLKISDYIEGCPGGVLSDLCEMVCRRARKMDWSESDRYVGYLRSDEFILRNRSEYIRRSRNLIRSDVGEHADLMDSVQRLLDSGMLMPDDIRNSYMSWTNSDSRRRVGFCSTMFRVVGISAALDDPEIPDFVRDYVVYHECLHLRQGYRPSHRHHDGVFRSWEHSFPEWKDAENILRRLRRGIFYPL